LLAIDHKTKYLWLQCETSILYAPIEHIIEIRIIQSQAGFSIYAKLNLLYRFEDHLLDTKKTIGAAKKFAEDFVRVLQKEEYIKNMKGTIFIKKKSIIGFSVIGTDLAALLENNPIPIILASYKTEEDAIEALNHFIDTGTYKTEKIKLDETSLLELNKLIEEIKAN